MIDEAIKMANDSPMRRFATGAVIFSKRGEILSKGCSHISSLRLHSLYSIHSEIHALHKVRHLNLYGATIAIATIARKSGNLTSAKPCSVCASMLYAAGIREAIYTVDNCTHATLDLEKRMGLKVYKSRDILEEERG